MSNLSIHALRRGAAIALAAFLACAAQGASAAELKVATGVPPGSTLGKASSYFADEMNKRTQNRLGAKVYAGSLLNLAETLNGLRDGVADVGFVVPPYHRAELPLTNLLIDLGMAGDDPIAMAGATNEYLFNCAPCRKEYLAYNQVFMGTASLPPYVVMSRMELKSADDIKGKKIRSFSAYGRWVEQMGGVVVTLSANDIYEGLNQRTIDANMHPATELVNLSLGDVAKYVLDLPLGVLVANNLFNVNLDTWNDMTPADRKTYLEVSAESLAYAIVLGEQFNQEVLTKRAKEMGVTVVKPDPALVEATKKFVDADLKKVAIINRDNYKVADAEARVADYLKLVEKWRGLVKGIDRNDHKAVAALLNREVFSKLDAETLAK